MVLEVSTAVDVAVELLLFVLVVVVAVDVAVDVDVGEVVCVVVAVDDVPVFVVVVVVELVPVLVVVAAVEVVVPLVEPLVMVSDPVCPSPHPSATLAAIRQGIKALREARAPRTIVTGECTAIGATTKTDRCSRKLMSSF